MKNLIPFFACALLLAGCADDATNPWSTEQERADAKVAKAETAAPAVKKPVAVEPTSTEATTEAKYSFQKKAAAEAAAKKPEELAAGKAKITAMRGDAGLIQIKRNETSAPGDKLVLTKDGKTLLITVHSVEGEAVIADIAPLQVNKPEVKVGDEVICAPYEEPAK